MTTQFAIIDKTNNSEHFILNPQDEMCQFWTEAQLYETREEAQRQIENAGWGEWAEIREVTPEML